MSEHRLPPPMDATGRKRIRDAEIRAAYASGHYTLSAIAKRYRLTDSRIWQIVHKHRRTQPMGDQDA
jgi:Mor family transcriptional regulator